MPHVIMQSSEGASVSTERVPDCIVERIVDVPVPPVSTEILKEIMSFFPSTSLPSIWGSRRSMWSCRTSRRRFLRISWTASRGAFPRAWEQNVDVRVQVVMEIPRESIPERTAEQIVEFLEQLVVKVILEGVGVPLPHITKEMYSHQVRISERTKEQNVDVRVPYIKKEMRRSWTSPRRALPESTGEQHVDVPLLVVKWILERIMGNPQELISERTGEQTILEEIRG